MPTLDESAPGVLAALAAHYGWREAGVPARRNLFEGMVAAILGRSADPRKVATALEGLRGAGLLIPENLAAADPRVIAETLKAGGFALTTKALGPLIRVARWLVEEHGGSAESLADLATDELREALLGLNGIGRPTADAILLFGLGRSSYPVDRASYRIAARHGWIDPLAEYDEARAVLERLASDDTAALARLSGWLETIGRDYCKPASPRCERCPLRPFLPPQGAIIEF